MNKVNLFPGLMSSFSSIFLSSLSSGDEVALVANLDRNYLAKGTARSNNTSLPWLPNVLSRNPPNWTILSNWKFYIRRHIVNESTC